MAKCAVCGRTLKSARSIARGVGPDCGKKARKGKRFSLRPGLGPSGGSADIGGSDEASEDERVETEIINC